MRSAQLLTASRSMLTNAATWSRPWPNVTASAIWGKYFSLFSMYLGANIAPSLSFPTSFARSMMRRCPSSSSSPASPVCTQPSPVFVSRVASSFL